MLIITLTVVAVVKVQTVILRASPRFFAKRKRHAVKRVEVFCAIIFLRKTVLSVWYGAKPEL